MRVVALALLLASCAGAAVTPSADPIAGTYSGAGGGAALANVKVLAEAFKRVHPTVNWGLENVGSTAAINLVKQNSVDLGFVSRELKADERTGIETLSIGVVGTAAAVNAMNAMTGLSKAQIRDIFSGKITDWKDVGGKPGAIRVFIREPDAATRSAFEEFFFEGKPTYAKGAIEVNGLDEMMRSLRSFADGIAMISLDDRTLADSQLRLLSIDGAPATKEALQSGTYPVRRPLYLIYPTNAAKLRPGVRAFLDFVTGPEGQKILAGL